MKRCRTELGSIEVEGQSGAGMVKVQMTCKYDVRRVSIDESVMDDREMLEDLVAAAPQRRRAQGRGGHPGEMSSVTRRAEPAAGHEAAVLSGGPMSPSSLDELIEALRCLPGVGPKVGAAHGLSSAAA